MTFRLVEDYSTDNATVQVSGRTLPVPALVEDNDGIRALLLGPSAASVAARVWSQAHAGGAAFLVAVEDENIYSVMPAEFFMEHRTEQPTTASYGIVGWSGYVDPNEPPQYRHIVAGDLPAAPAQPENLDGFVHLHTHSEYSALDGLSKVDEMVAAVVADGGKFLASADHGTCAVHPELQEKCDAAGIKAIFGMEAYFVPDRHRRGTEWYEDENGQIIPVERIEEMTSKEKQKLTRMGDSKEALGEYTHITLWAMNDIGLRNLWSISTEGHLEGFYGHPRIDWDTLERLNEGIIASTGCLRGPVPQAILKGDMTKARQEMSRLLHIFGDRLYVEVHTNHLEEQIRVNHELLTLAREMGVPPIAAVDSHYARREDAPVHRAWLAMQTNKDLTDDSSLFAGGQDYHMMTTGEVIDSLMYLGPETVLECVSNTVSLALRCDAKVTGATTTPTYSKASTEHPDPVQRDVERVVDICLANWERKIVGKRYPIADAEARFEREMSLLISKQFCGYFLVCWDYVHAAKTRPAEEGGPILVGPGRGSGGGSLVAYLMDIVEIDPLDADLLFERFLTEGRTSLPDFDIDFPASERGWLKNYVTKRWGAEYVTTIGTVLRLQSKGAFNDSARVLKNTLPYEVDFRDQNALKKLIDAADAPLAGKHMPWDEFCAAFADVVDPLREKYPEVFAMTDKVVTRVKSYGKHAAGVVISTDPANPLTYLPLRLDKDGNVVTQFDMVALEHLGYVKFDLLTLRTLDTIQVALNLIKERFGVEVDIYNWKQEYSDPQVWDAVASGQTLGLFQVETRAGTRLTRRFEPHTVHDLAAVMTLVRPGPSRSGLTETYLRRRSGIEQVTFQEPRLEAVLGETYGCLIYQEDIMQTTMVLAGYSSNEADGVRKILGKKQVEKVAAAGHEFVSRAVANGTSQDIAATLWEQMAEFAKYSFNKAHAYGYAVLGYWTAWLKFHYPVQFLAAALTTVDDERIPDFINEARRMGYAVLGPDINESAVSFRPEQMTMRYGLLGVKNVGLVPAEQIVANQPYTSYEDFLDRAVKVENSKVNMGHVKTLVAVGAFDTMIPNRRALEMQLERESTGEAKACTFKVEGHLNEHNLPCTFDWANEVDPPMVTKGRGKLKVLTPKPPPKKCTTACRNYTKPPSIGPEDVQPYGEADIRDREKELLGVWLSSTPFDLVSQETRDLCMSADEIEAAAPSITEGYIVVAIVEEVREARDRNGGKYAWVTLTTETGSIDTICFSKSYANFKNNLHKDALLLVLLWKTERGTNIIGLSPA